MANNDLVDYLLKDGVLKTPALVKAFSKIDRKDFVPEEFLSEAYANHPLPIGFNQTISQPWTVAFMLELLKPQKGNKILDIGSGSGWQTCILAEIIGEKGKVVAVERIKELKELGENNAKKYGFKNIEFICADGSKSLKNYTFFDRIIAAASGREIPRIWLEELKEGGILVAPVKSKIVKIRKLKDAEFQRQEFEGFSFVPLLEN